MLYDVCVPNTNHTIIPPKNPMKFACAHMAHIHIGNRIINNSLDAKHMLTVHILHHTTTVAHPYSHRMRSNPESKFFVCARFSLLSKRKGCFNLDCHKRTLTITIPAPEKPSTTEIAFFMICQLPTELGYASVFNCSSTAKIIHDSIITKFTFVQLQLFFRLLVFMMHGNKSRFIESFCNQGLYIPPAF